MKIHKWFSFLACMFLLGACSDDDKALGEQGVIVKTAKRLVAHLQNKM